MHGFNIYEGMYEREEIESFTKNVVSDMSGKSSSQNQNPWPKIK